MTTLRVMVSEPSRFSRAVNAARTSPQMEEAYAKVKNLALAARLLRERHGSA